MVTFGGVLGAQIFKALDGVVSSSSIQKYDLCSRSDIKQGLGADQIERNKSMGSGVLLFTNEEEWKGGLENNFRNYKKRRVGLFEKVNRVDRIDWESNFYE